MIDSTTIEYEPMLTKADIYERFLKWQKGKKENKENKGDKNMDDLEVILQKYKKYQIDFIDAETETNLANLREKSKIGKLVKKIKEQFIKEIEKIYPEEKNIENFVSISYVDTKDLREKIDEEIELHDIQIESLNSDIDDARALLKIAETYEQKMQILKNYNIIDEEGRINIYE